MFVHESPCIYLTSAITCWVTSAANVSIHEAVFAMDVIKGPVAKMASGTLPATAAASAAATAGAASMIALISEKRFNEVRRLDRRNVVGGKINQWVTSSANSGVKVEYQALT